MPTFPAARYRNALPATCLPACRFAFHWPLRPPRRLSPRFPRRFSHRLLIAPSACRPCRLHTVRAAFSERPSRRSSDVITVRSVSASQSHMPAYIAFGHRAVISSYGRNLLAPFMPPFRSDMAAARLSRRMAPRRAVRASLTFPFGADRHGSRWCQQDMYDAVIYARSRRSSGQRIPDTDIEARETCGMRYACRGSGQLRYWAC